MEFKTILEQISSCNDCKTCLDSCDTYKVTQNIFQSPNGRLEISEKIFHNEEILDNEIIGIYTCTLCAACNLACQQEINISEIIHSSKVKLVEKGLGPLPNHKKIIQAIKDTDNSVGGTPEERLDWIPQELKQIEKFEKNDSDTLLFLGCMSSFRVKESATASYKILKKADYNFKLMQKEPCCGEYIYSAGNLEVAKNVFMENSETFKKMGIKNIIVTCGGCLYAFDTVYPKYVKEFNIKVRHIVDVIHELETEGKIKLYPLKQSITYHDPCRLGRKYENGPLYDEPRVLLEKCGLDIKEIADKHEYCPCCGAGSGIRGVDSIICIKIGKALFEKITTKEIVSSCPLCVFNFRYVSYKNHLDQTSKYITDYILESMTNKKND